MAVLLLSLPQGGGTDGPGSSGAVGGRRAGAARVLGGRGRGGRGRLPFVGSSSAALRLPLLGGDQFVQPADLALGGLQPDAVQLARVVVDLLAGARQRRPQALPALLHAATPALEDAHPHLDRRPGEEGQVDAEALVVPRLGTGLGEQLVEPVLALGGEREDAPPPAGLGAPGAAGGR